MNIYGTGFVYDGRINIVYGDHKLVREWVISQDDAIGNYYSSQKKVDKQLDYYRELYGDNLNIHRVEEAVKKQAE
jgi:hypothetical protein